MEDAVGGHGASATRLPTAGDVLTEAELREHVRALYLAQRLSAPRISQALPIGTTKVYEILEELGVPRRRQTDAQGSRDRMPAQEARDRARTASAECEEPRFGPRLRAARRAARVGVRRLARAAGIGHGLISRIENGHESPSLEMAERLAWTLGLDRDDVCPPHRCGCRPECEELTYSTVKMGHAPTARAGQPVLERCDRPDRSPDDEGLTVGERVGARVRRRRLEMGLTQADLGRLVHATWTTISNIEADRSMPSEQLARLLASKLGVDPVAFFELAPCPCDRADCQTLAVGGRYTRGCSPLPEETRARLAHQAEKRWRQPEWREYRDWVSARLEAEWRAGGPMVRGLFALAAEGEAAIPIPSSTRQEFGRAWGGNTLAPERGRRPGFTAEQARDVIRHRADGLSIGKAAYLAGVTKDQAAYILRREAAAETV